MYGFGKAVGETGIVCEGILKFILGYAQQPSSRVIASLSIVGWDSNINSDRSEEVYTRSRGNFLCKFLRSIQEICRVVVSDVMHHLLVSKGILKNN